MYSEKDPNKYNILYLAVGCLVISLGLINITISIADYYHRGLTNEYNTYFVGVDMCSNIECSGEKHMQVCYNDVCIIDNQIKPNDLSGFSISCVCISKPVGPTCTIYTLPDGRCLTS